MREQIAQKDGWVLWPPIPYSYDTINYDLRVPAPSPPRRRRTGWAPTTRAATCSRG